MASAESARLPLRLDPHGCMEPSASTFLFPQGNWQPRRLLLSCPLLHRLGGQYGTEMIKEKLRSETATYGMNFEALFMSSDPQLSGFRLPTGLAVGVRSNK